MLAGVPAWLWVFGTGTLRDLYRDTVTYSSLPACRRHSDANQAT
jgi:hypothetical protein